MEGWSPWRALRKRERAVFGLADLEDDRGGAVALRVGEREVILIDRRLMRTERKVALAHELVHLERGGIVHDPDDSPMWSPVVAREENRVDQIVAGRLVPREELVDWLTARDEPTTALDVAEEFDVTEAVAVLALLAVLDGPSVLSGTDQ